MKTIIASKDSVLRRLISDLLTGPSNQVQTTSKSSELIQWILEEDIDLIVVDFELIGMDGVESLPILKQIRPQVPIIMISSGLSWEASRGIAEAGVFYHFNKPIDPQDMLQVVTAAKAHKKIRNPQDKFVVPWE